MTTAPAQPAPPIPPRLAARFHAFAGDIKLAHTVFALPFALLAMVLAGQTVPGGVRGGQIGLILLCMVFARTFAMGANRLLDADMDAENPRTARRAIPAGRTTKGFTAAVLAACAAGFILAASGFGLFYGNWLPALLGVPVLAFLGLYPLLKRFTALCHYYLGLALALAPVCAWIAVAGGASATVLLMAAGVLCWTAGFDIIYGCQDLDFDRAAGVHSVPAMLGVRRALWVSRATHLLSVGFLIGVGFASPHLGVVYFVGVAVAAGLLLVEHALVWGGDLRRVGMAFFTMNGLVSLVLGTLGIVDALL